MKNQMTRKKSVIVFILTAVLAIVLSSCSSGNEEYSQELQNQVSALQTQNALLQENLNSQENQEEVPEPPSNEEPGAALLLQTPTPESLPTEPVPAGEPIVYDGWSMTVSKEINIDNYYKLWGVTVYLRNLGETNRIFRFTNAAVTASDNLGNIYEPSPYCQYCTSCEDAYHFVKNLEIEGLKRETIKSGSQYYSCWSEENLGSFNGPIPLDAEYLIIHFDGFGPFSNVDVIIDL
jgi:hypothetical protein